MADGMSWKRPWEEDDKISNSRHHWPPSRATTLSAYSPPQASSTSDSVSLAHGQRQLPPLQAVNYLDSQSFGTKPHSNALPHLSEGVLDAYVPRIPAHKRQRREEPFQHGDTSADLSSPRSPINTRRNDQSSLFGAAGEYDDSLKPANPKDVSRRGDGFQGHVPEQSRERNLTESNQVLPIQSCGAGCNSDDVVKDITVRLSALQAALSSALTENILGHASKSDVDRAKDIPDVAECGLHCCLHWVLDSIDSISRVGKDLTLQATQSYLQSLSSETNSSRAFHTPFERMKRASEYPARRRNEATRSSFPLSDENLQDAESTHNSHSSQSEQRRSVGDLPQHMQTSPRRTAPSSISSILRGQSPTNYPPTSRFLPSPYSPNFSPSSNMLPPISPTSLASQTAHTAHLQDLQHQISTKSLANQILQREHDNLLSAFERSKIRYGTLFEKSQVSDAEINSLAEERTKLQSQIESLETQIEDLQQSRDEAVKQSVASGSQYMKIMAMSSKLQAQSAEDMKKWKNEREEWQREKQDFTKKIQDLHRQYGDSLKYSDQSDNPLNSMSPDRHPTWSSREPPTPTELSQNDAHGDIMRSTSLAVLRDEIARLRKNQQNTEVVVQKLRDENAAIDEFVENINSIRRVQVASDEIDEDQRHERPSPKGHS